MLGGGYDSDADNVESPSTSSSSAAPADTGRAVGGPPCQRRLQLRLHPSRAIVGELQPHASGGDLRGTSGSGREGKSRWVPSIPPPSSQGRSQDGTSPSGKGAFGVTS
jgi:hypothetical protein